jgi:hypothetical protein
VNVGALTADKRRGAMLIATETPTVSKSIHAVRRAMSLLMKILHQVLSDVITVLLLSRSVGIKAPTSLVESYRKLAA